MKLPVIDSENPAHSASYLMCIYSSVRIHRNWTLNYIPPTVNHFACFTVFIRINAPGAMHFSKGGATITDTNTQLLSAVAMGDNWHLQPWTRLPACIMVREFKILATNLKSEEIIMFYLIFCWFQCICHPYCHVLFGFSLYLVSGIRLGKY